MLSTLQQIANNRLSTDVPEDEKSEHNYAQGWDALVTLARKTLAEQEEHTVLQTLKVMDVLNETVEILIHEWLESHGHSKTCLQDFRVTSKEIAFRYYDAGLRCMSLPVSLLWDSEKFHDTCAMLRGES